MTRYDGEMVGLARLPRSITFGEGVREDLPGHVVAHGRRVLLCTDARLAGDAEFATLGARLRQAGCTPTVFAGVEPDVPVDNIRTCYEWARRDRPEVVVGIGGGSCLDLAKAVAVLLAHGGDIDDYIGELKVPGPIVPVVAVPTTAGTGSEATPVAVLWDPARKQKIGISSPYLIPQSALCDPQLTAGCPPGLTASAGADALSHCIESFTARDAERGTNATRVFIGKNALADLFALEGMAHLAASLPTAVAHGDDAHARSEVMMGALLGGCALSTAGTAAAHAIQYPVGALTGTAHGLGVGVLLPYVMEFNRPARVREFAAIADIFDQSRAGEQDRSYAAIDHVSDLLTEIGIPTSLAELGVHETDLDKVAALAMTADRLIRNNPRPLDLTAVSAITRAAFTADRAGLRSFANADRSRERR